MSRATVLVVENDPTTRELLRGHLVQRGHRVSSESEGEWALAVAEAEAVDLVVLDQRLSDLSGLDVLRRLRAGVNTKDLPVVLLGGPYADPPPRLEAWAPVVFEAKPLDLDRLAAVVDELVAPERRRRRPVEVDDAGPIPLSGDVQTFPFARLLGRLAEERGDGAVLLQKSAAKKVAFFEGGRPVFVQSNLLSESLGQVVLQERLCSEAELESALSQKRRSGRPLGDVLVGRGALSEHQLAHALERQMEKKLFDLFAWTEGTFRHRPGAVHSGPRVTLPLGPVGLVFEGAARGMSTERIEQDLSRERHRLARAVDPNRVRDAVLALEPGALSLLERLEAGTEPLEALFQDREVGRPEMVRLVYALVVTGELGLTDPAPPVLSEDLRDQVRARLDAEMRRIEHARRRAPATIASPGRVEPVDPEEAEAISRRLDRAARELEGRDFFQILGLSADADDEALRRAHRRASREHDPERLLGGRDAPDLLRRAEANHARVVRAFQVLSDPAGRALYAAFLGDPEAALLPELRAADWARSAERDLAEGRCAASARAFERAAELEPSVAYYAAAAAFAAHRSGAPAEDALAAIRAARVRAPDDPECMMLEASLLEALGQTESAEELYRAAAAVDPSSFESGVARVAEADETPRGVMAKVAEGARALFGRATEP